MLINIFVVATIILAFSMGYLLIQYILFNPNNLSFTTSSSKIFDINNTLLWEISEMLFAVKLNNVLSKSEILELYLNNIYFGNLNYGIESASQNYFGQSAKELSLSECAFLAGISQWPGVYNPYGDLSLGLNRQKVVLQAMLNQNYISQEEYSHFRKYKLKFTRE